MKSLIKYALAVALASAPVAAAFAGSNGWLTSYPDALRMSKKTGKAVLANFTGSDWCPFCIRLDKEVFETPEFKKWAAKYVVLLELDFPHKTPQDVALRRQNNDLARKYGVLGFPSVYFLHADGKAFGRYGYEPGGSEHWTTMADRLVNPKVVARRPLRFAAAGDDYPAKVKKNLYADNDLRGKSAPKLVVGQWLSGKAPDTKGKVVLIDFWATWCPPCRELIPELNTWHKKFGDDLVVIGISDEKPSTLKSFMKNTPMTYNVASDTNSKTAKVIGIMGIPHCLIITPDNVVRWQGFPGSDEEPLTDAIIQQIIDVSKKQEVGSRKQESRK